jgi:hypothetical protein
VTTVIAVALLAACFACARGFVLGGDRITSRLVPVLLLTQVRVRRGSASISMLRIGSIEKRSSLTNIDKAVVDYWICFDID